MPGRVLILSTAKVEPQKSARCLAVYPERGTDAKSAEQVRRGLYQDHRRKQKAQKAKQDVLGFAASGSVLKHLEDARLRKDYVAAVRTLESIPPEGIRFYQNGGQIQENNKEQEVNPHEEHRS